MFGEPARGHQPERDGYRHRIPAAFGGALDSPYKTMGVMLFAIMSSFGELSP